MKIDKYFKNIIARKIDMQKALKKYVEATEDFYTLTGTKYTDMPKTRGKSLGFDDLMMNIEKLYNEYLEYKKDYDKVYKECMEDINKLDNQTHRLIIEYSFIDEKKDKDIIDALSGFHNKDYSYSYFRRLKTKAIEEFEKKIHFDTK